MKLLSKKTEILDAAQELIQMRGYNGFSFANISKIVGIRKSSIHHHFPSKAALGIAVIRRYREEFHQQLIKYEQMQKSWLDKLALYAKLYEDVLVGNKLCLCGMLASDIETLPRILRKEIRSFFDDNIVWLVSILKTHYLTMPSQRLNEIAWHIISSLQGGIIMARMQVNKEIFSVIARELLLGLENR